MKIKFYASIQLLTEAESLYASLPEIEISELQLSDFRFSTNVRTRLKIYHNNNFCFAIIKAKSLCSSVSLFFRKIDSFKHSLKFSSRSDIHL